MRGGGGEGVKVRKDVLESVLIGCVSGCNDSIY